MSKFLHDDDNDDTKTIAITRVFSENSRAENLSFAKTRFPHENLKGSVESMLSYNGQNPEINCTFDTQKFTDTKQVYCPF